MKEKRLLKIRIQNVGPSVRIGKQGVTEGIIGEIKKQLEKKKIVKIKCLKSFMQTADKKKLAEELAEKTDSRLVSQVGFIIVLAKK